ncbi:MAG: hypothetical protein WD939_10455 [Dehalococcoidia bacterium]
MENEVIEELRLQTAILRAGFKKDLDALAEAAASNEVSAAIIAHLRENGGSTKSSDLKAAIPKMVPSGTEASGRTIARRLAGLENIGVLVRTGQAQNTEYRLTGLVS